LLRIPVAAPSRATVVELQTQPGGVSAAAGVVWVGANAGLARLDATQLPPALTTVPVDVKPNYHAAFPGGVWVSELHANRVSKIC